MVAQCEVLSPCSKETELLCILWGILVPPKVQKHECKVKKKLKIVCKCVCRLQMVVYLTYMGKKTVDSLEWHCSFALWQLREAPAASWTS